MLNKIHKGQGVVWVILIIAIVALIALWISKNPSAPSTTTTENETITPTSESLSPTPSQSLQEIEKALKNLNTDSTEIDKSLNDSQLDITQ